MDTSIKNVFVLAPHADDGEFSCGGTIKRFTEEGIEVYYIVFSPCNKSLPEGYVYGQLYEELDNAVSHLGISKDHIIKFDFEVREFPQNRQPILEELVALNKKYKPDLVLLPNSDDVHQDHHTIYEEGVRAFKHTRVLGYELPWNSLHFRNNFHIKLEKHHIDAKTDAIAEYKSQSFRNYKDKEFFYGLAKVRGVQANMEYAEAFEMIKWSM
jgi:LmbE family N-acetylglucosaminyl deacetylase